jgi:hypothetical protein
MWWEDASPREGLIPSLTCSFIRVSFPMPANGLDGKKVLVEAGDATDNGAAKVKGHAVVKDL